jgi:hypothetical protein
VITLLKIEFSKNKMTFFTQAAGNRQRACLLIAEMSSSGNLAKGDYTKGKARVISYVHKELSFLN